MRVVRVSAARENDGVRWRLAATLMRFGDQRGLRSRSAARSRNRAAAKSSKNRVVTRSMSTRGRDDPQQGHEMERVTDDELEAELHRLMVLGRRVEARIVTHLIEVEQRRLHLATGYDSLFESIARSA